MARSRNIKPSVMANEDLAALAPVERLLFIYLWMLADREGRLEDRPRRIRAEALPYDPIDADVALNAIQAAGFIARYEVAGKRIIQINSFTKHQSPHHKEVASALPPAPGTPAITRHAYDVTMVRRLAIFERDGNQCLKCSSGEALTIDHIMPLSRGGDNSDENLQTLCHSCNSAKGDATKSYRADVVAIETARSNYKEDSTLPQRCHEHGASCPSDCGFLIPDSLIPDSLIGDADQKPLGDSDESPAEDDADQPGNQQAAKPAKAYSDEFEAFWREYPRRHRASPKPEAWKKWQARLKAGVSPDDLITAATNYRLEQQAFGKLGTEYVKQPSTFLGAGEHWTPYVGDQPALNPQGPQASAVLSVPKHSQEMYPNDRF